MTAQPHPPLTVAAVLVALQGVVLIVLGVLEGIDTERARLTLGITTAAFFVVYGALLVAGAWALSRARGWSRGPVLITQLIALGLAWNLREVLPVALLLLAVAVGVIAGVLHPDSIDALSGEPDEPDL